jgi:hypothetical protein
MTTEWYLKTDGKDLGPLSFEELIVLVKAGALTDDDLVRPSSHVAWRRAQAIPGLIQSTAETPPKSAWLETMTSALASVDARRRAAQRRQSLRAARWAGASGASFAGRAAIGLVRLFRSAAVSIVDSVMCLGENVCRSLALRTAMLGAVVAAAMVVGYSAIPASWLLSTAGAYQTVEEIGHTFRELHNRDAIPPELESYAEESRRRLATVVPILEQRASNDQAARELVWAARDCLPRMIAAATDQQEPSDKVGRRFENHMARAKKRLARPSRQSHFNATTIGIVLLDVVVVAILIRAFRVR